MTHTECPECGSRDIEQTDIEIMYGPTNRGSIGAVAPKYDYEDGVRYDCQRCDWFTEGPVPIPEPEPDPEPPAELLDSDEAKEAMENRYKDDYNNG